MHRDAPECLSSLSYHNTGQIKIQVVLTDFDSVNNIEKLHKKSANDKIQRLNDWNHVGKSTEAI